MGASFDPFDPDSELPRESSLKLHNPLHVDAMARIIYDIEAKKSRSDKLSWADFSSRHPGAAYFFYWLEAARVLESAGLYSRADVQLDTSLCVTDVAGAPATFSAARTVVDGEMHCLQAEQHQDIRYIIAEVRAAILFFGPILFAAFASIFLVVALWSMMSDPAEKGEGGRLDEVHREAGR